MKSKKHIVLIDEVNIEHVSEVVGDNRDPAIDVSYLTKYDDVNFLLCMNPRQRFDTYENEEKQDWSGKTQIPSSHTQTLLANNLNATKQKWFYNNLT